MNDFTKPFDPELAIKLSKLVHDQCDRPPHDIGASLAQIVHEHIKPLTPAEAEGLVDALIMAIVNYEDTCRNTSSEGARQEMMDEQEKAEAALIAALTGGSR